jgi:hypothetical protein
MTGNIRLALRDVKKTLPMSLGINKQVVTAEAFKSIPLVAILTDRKGGAQTFCARGSRAREQEDYGEEPGCRRPSPFGAKDYGEEPG